jgi:hypothetical protein
MTADDAGLRARNLRTLGLLAGLFLLPLAVAFYMYYGTAWRPAAHVNHGTLIAPLRPLPAVALPQVPPGAAITTFHGQWTLVYIGSGDCDDACRDSLYLMRQTRAALNTDMSRVARVFLITGQCCALGFLTREHPGLVLIDASGAAAAPLLQRFPPQRAHTLFVVDPLGNLMMSYDATSNPRGLLEDLQKLLRLSQIG